MTRSLELASGRLRPESLNGAPLSSFRNKIINGGFDVWQRASSQNTTGYLSVDRWIMANGGTAMTTSRQDFALGQTEVPGNPKYYIRHVVNSVVGAANLAESIHRIEGVHTLSGKKATLTFWAKADAPKNIAIDFYQHFGTGGTPSADVSGIEAQQISLTTSWKKYSILVNIPSVFGSLIGTSLTDSLQIIFWFDAGSNYNARTNSLGHQSGTFDIARVSLVEGDARLEDDPFESRDIHQERTLCQRFCQIVGRGFVGRWNSNTSAEVFGKYPELRATPSVSFFTSSATIYRVGISAETATGLSFAGLNLGITGGQVTISNTNLTSPNAGEVAALMTDCILLNSEI